MLFDADGNAMQPLEKIYIILLIAALRAKFWLEESQI